MEISQPGVVYILGPTGVPPQGVKALVGALLRPDDGGPKVSCVLCDQSPGETELEFTNEGVWSYDGRHKRLRRHASSTDEAFFHLMYG